LLTICKSTEEVLSSLRNCWTICRPHTKGDEEINQMAETIMDKVVDQLLNEAAEAVLRED